MKELIETYHGQDIYVVDGGKFVAEIGDREIKRASLAAVRSMIAKQVTPVRSHYINKNYDGVVFVRERHIIEFKNGRARTIEDGLDPSYAGYNYILTDDQLAEIERISNEQKRLVDELEKIKDAAIRLTSKNIDQHREPK